MEINPLNPLKFSAPYFTPTNFNLGNSATSISQNEIDPNTIFNTINDQFYVHVPIDMTSSLVSEAVEAFFAFLKEPAGVTSQITGKIAQQHRRGELGLFHREPEDNGYGDKKDFFHYHPCLRETCKQILETNKVVNTFISKADEIWQLAANTAKKVIGSLENFYPGIYNQVFQTDRPHLILRFLTYQWDSTQELLAKPHFDAGSFTLALAESCPGLRIGSSPLNLKEVTHNPGKTVFMLGANFKNLIPSSTLSPGWHDVVMLNKEQIGTSHVRWALVMFIDGHNITAPSRADTHPWSTGNQILEVKDRV